MKYRATLQNSDGLSSPTFNSLSIAYQDKTNRDLSEVELSFKNSKPSKDLDKDTKAYSQRNDNTFKGEDDRLINGTIKVYKNNSKIEEIHADSHGKWKKELKIKAKKSFNLKFKYYDMHDTFLYDETYRMEVDTEDPVFIDFPQENQYYPPLKKLSFPATDNDKIKKYKIYLQGRIYTNQTPEFTLPGNLKAGTYPLTVKAYDRAGNTAKKSIKLKVGYPPKETEQVQEQANN